MKILKTVVAVFLASSIATGGGKVYFVIGSDTGLWAGLDVSDYHPTISGALYTDPTANAARVMQPAFRSSLTDAHGTPMKLTWWMMAGNMFRFSTNTDVPVPSTMPVYLMKRYHGQGIAQWGDELTFHYHTWVWTDYNGDGTWYWNQAKSYDEFVPDFDQTLAEMLLEEEVFPVSFRSGWHAMENRWQQRLDLLLPYSLHNDWPAVHNDLIEPIDNVYDWSRAPSAFVPFHPSPNDYQVPGNGRGWNVRSAYLAGVDSAFVATLFARAAIGQDQVVCLWAHLPEADFPDNLQKANAAIHAASRAFPAIDYRYCTAVEAMQRWLKGADTTAPQVTMEETGSGSDVRWTIQCDEPIFQPEPFVAVKDRYDQYQILALEKTGPLEWTTATGIPRQEIAKVGVAVTDTAGNHRIQIRRYLPDALFVDNGDAGYQELAGSWQTTSGSGFGASFRVASIPQGDSAQVRWQFALPIAGTYNIHLRVPASARPASGGSVRWGLSGGETTATFSRPFGADAWNYIGTLTATGTATGTVVVTARGAEALPVQFAADAIRISSLVREKWIEAPEALDAGSMIVDEQNIRTISIKNSGILPCQILGARLASGTPAPMSTMPLALPAMGEALLSVTFSPAAGGALLDTLIVSTDDPRHAELRIVIHALAREWFAVVDDRDSLQYGETGAWAFSVAAANNATSRYAYPAPGISATFSVRLKKPGIYDIGEIVPTTVNASVRARYVLMIGSTRIDSVFLDQNAGSGSWVRLWLRTLPADTGISVRLTDAMSPIVAGKVLRADAIQFQWVAAPATDIPDQAGVKPGSFMLHQNHPNPFNPKTTIAFEVTGIVNGARDGGSTSAWVRLSVFDLLGREVAVIENGMLRAGRHTRQFDASGLSSGVYFCRLLNADNVQTIKMILAR